METAKKTQPVKDPSMEAMILSAKRKSTSLSLIKELNEKFSLKNLPAIEEDGKKIEFLPIDIAQNFIKTQKTLLATLLVLSIDFDKKEYFIMDLRNGERYPEEKENGKKKNEK